MKCPVCGAQNDPGTAYCYLCGSSLRQANQPATGQTVLMGSNTVTEPQPDRTETTARTYESPSVAPPPNQSRSYDTAYATPPTMDQRAFDASNHPLMQPAGTDPQQPAPQYQQSAPQYQQMPSAQTPYLVTSVTLNGSQTSTMAVFSLVLGILSWMVLPMIGAIGGIVTGHMARREIMNSDGRFTGMGMALAGLILSYINLFASLALCALFAVLVATS